MFNAGEVFSGVGKGRWVELVETNTDTDSITVCTDKIIKVLGNKSLLYSILSKKFLVHITCDFEMP